MKKVHLLVIDPQHDFCHPSGALYVGGAENDMSRLADMIARLGSKIDDIHCTVDSHHLMDVAHPAWWKNSSGQHPDPFTIITAADVENGTWTPTIVNLTRKMIEYVKSLEKGGRYPLCVWPPHCLIGSPGAVVVPEMFEQFSAWCIENKATIDWVAKGSNIYTEHYSGVKAEVPDPNDATTQLNTRLIGILEEADIIALAGEAGSHCLANTVRDIADGFSDPQFVEKFVLLTDATSPVAGFENLQHDFINEMVGRGMKTATTREFLA